MKHKKYFKWVCIVLLGVVVLSGCKTTKKVHYFLSESTRKTNYHISEAILKLTPEMSDKKKQALIEQLTNNDPDERRAGIMAISHGKPGRWNVTPELLSVVVKNDRDQLVQTIAIERLVVVAPNKEVVTLLGDTIKNSSKGIQLACVIGIGEIASPKSMAILQEQLNYNDHDAVRRAAATALGSYHKKSVVNALIKALNDDAFEVYYHARLSLIAICGQDFSYDDALWKKWIMQNEDAIFTD